MKERSSNSGTASPNPKYKTTVAIQPRSNRSAELRKQHQSQRSPVSPYSHSMAHLEFDDDFDSKQCSWSEYHCGCKPHYQTNDCGGSLSRSASLSRIRSRSANNSRSPSRFSSVLSLPSPGNSVKSPKGAKFAHSPKGGSTFSRSESALNARFPDDSSTDWLDGRLNNVPCIDMGRELPPVKTKYKHPFYEKKKKRVRSGNAGRGDTRSTVSDVTDANDNQENKIYQNNRDRDSSYNYQRVSNKPSAGDVKKKTSTQRPEGTLLKTKTAEKERQESEEDKVVDVTYVPTCEKIEQQEISCFISPSTSSVSSHEARDNCEVLEDDVYGSPRGGREVPKSLKLDNFEPTRQSRSPEKENKRTSGKYVPTSAKQNSFGKTQTAKTEGYLLNGNSIDSHDSSPEETEGYSNYGSGNQPNQKVSPKEPGSKARHDNTYTSEDFRRGYDKTFDKTSPLSINVNNTSENDEMYCSSKGLGSTRGSNSSPTKYRSKTTNEPFKDDLGNEINRMSPYKNSNPNNQSAHSINQRAQNSERHYDPRFANGSSPPDYKDDQRSPGKFSPKINSRLRNDRLGVGRTDPVKSVNSPRIHALGDQTDKQYNRNDKSLVEEPLIIPTKRNPVKLQPRNGNFSPNEYFVQNDDTERAERLPQNGEFDELPSTLFKPNFGGDNCGSEGTEITRYKGVEQPGENTNSVDPRDGKSGKNNPGIPVIRSEMNVYLNYLDVADGAENLSDTDTDIIIEKSDESESEAEDFRFIKDSKPRKEYTGRNESKKPAIETSNPRREVEPKHGTDSPHKRGFVKIDVKNNEKKQVLGSNKEPGASKSGVRQQNPSDQNVAHKPNQKGYSPQAQNEPSAERYTSSYYQKPRTDPRKPTDIINCDKSRNNRKPNKDSEVLADRTDYHNRPFVSEKTLIPDSNENLRSNNRDKPYTDPGRTNTKNKHSTPSVHRNFEEEKPPSKNYKGQPSQTDKDASANSKKPKAFSDNLFDRKTGKFVPDLDLDPNKVDPEDQFDQSLNVQTDLSHIFDSDEEELGSRIEKEIPPSKIDFDQVRHMFNSRKIYSEAEDSTDGYQKRKQLKDFGRISQGLVEKLRQYFDSKEMKARRELQFYRLIHEDLANKHNSMKQWDPLMLSPFDDKFVNQQQYRYWVLDARTKRTCERSLSIGRSPIDLEYLERNRYRYSVRESRNLSGYSSLGGSLLNTPTSSVVDLHKPRGRSESRASSRSSARKTPRGVKNMSHRRQNSDPLTVRMDPLDLDEHLLNEYNNLPPAVEDRDYKEDPDRYNIEDQPDQFVDEDLIIEERKANRSQEKPTQKLSNYNIKPSQKFQNLSSDNDPDKSRRPDPKKQAVGKYEIPYKTKPGTERTPTAYEGPFIEDFAPNKQPKHRSDRRYAARGIEKFEKMENELKNMRNEDKPPNYHKRNVSEHSPGTPVTDVGTPGYLNLDIANDSSPIFSDSSESLRDETSRLITYYTPQQYNSVEKNNHQTAGTRLENKPMEKDNKGKASCEDKKRDNKAPIGTRTVIHDPFNEDHSTYLKHEQERTFAYHPKSGKTFQLDSPRSMVSASSKDDPAFLIKTVKRTTEERLTHIESCDNLNEIEIDDSIREHANRLANFQYNEAQPEKREEPGKNKSSKTSGRKYSTKDNKNLGKFKSYDNLTCSTFDEGSGSLQRSQERSKSMDELNWSRREKRLENEKAEHSQNEDDHGSSLHQHNSSSMENLIDKGSATKVSKYNSQFMNDINTSHQSLNAQAPSVSSSTVNNALKSPGRERLIKKGKGGSSGGNPWSPSHGINGFGSRSPYSSTHSLNSAGNSHSQISNTFYTTNFGSGRQQETHFQPKEAHATQTKNNNNNNNNNNINSKPPIRQARVLFDFIPYTKRELGAKMGEIINIEQQVDENWVQASLRDQVGLIPLTYIEFIKPNQGPIAGKAFFGSMENGLGKDERDFQKPLHGSNQNVNQGRKSALVRPFQSQGEVVQRYDEPPASKNTQNNVLNYQPTHLKQQNGTQGSPIFKQDSKTIQNKNPANNNPAKSPLGLSNTRLGHVKYNFEAQTEIELDLRAGDIVNIRKQVDENWFDGYIGNRRGIFPIDYVEILPNDRQNGVTKNLSSQNGPEKPSTYTTASPNDQYFVAKNSAVPNNNSFQYPSVTQPYPQNSWNSTEEPQPKKSQEYCRVLYNFEPKQSDELELVENDVILVVKKCSDGWFIGSSTRTGHFGSFPGNYVEQLVYQ